MSDRDGNDEIYVMNADGTGSRRAILKYSCPERLAALGAVLSQPNTLTATRPQPRGRNLNRWTGYEMGLVPGAMLAHVSCPRPFALPTLSLPAMTGPATVVDRLASLPDLANIPRAELEWLTAHGSLEVYEAGSLIGPKGKRLEKLWIVLSGRISHWVDRGAGPRRVIEWYTGTVSGRLPYSRMKGPPGDNSIDETTELLGIREEHFPEMIQRCPVFTAHTVHLMLDRARSFNTSDLQDEKMISLGKLAAGLAHELNNPASAMVRGAKQLPADLSEAEAAARALCHARLSEEALDSIEQVRSACLAQPAGPVLSPIQQADREDEIADWFVRHQLNPDHAQRLAETAVTMEALDTLAGATEGETLEAALRWIAAGCGTYSLVADIEQAATRIYELVSAVKRFTYMDNPAGPEPTDVEAGLRDTVRVLAAKAKSKGAYITLDVEPDLPPVNATGSELNQVWSNLIDNALDAIHESGRVDISARKELDRVAVRVVDDGPGVPPDIVSKIFDPFFTTKPPGQGTGLGLDITRRLVRRYHGDIAVGSSQGRTEFRVTLAAEKSGRADVSDLTSN
jgi:signal transduction histidine kinase